MAGSVNKVILVGNLGRDPEVRHSQDGMKIVNMSIATSESWKDRNSGESREKTEWHRVVIFDARIADVAEKYLRKGSKVYLEGALQTRKWTDQSGQDKYTTEVVLGRFKSTLTMLDSKSSGSSGYDSSSNYNNNNNNSYNNTNSFGGSSDNTNQAPSVPDLDDEIPF